METSTKSRTADNFAGRLIIAMERAKVTQADLAREMDTAWSTVDRWLKGSIPRKKQIPLIARALGVASRWLESGDGAMIDYSPTDSEKIANQVRDGNHEDAVYYLSATKNPEQILDAIRSFLDNGKANGTEPKTTLQFITTFLRGAGRI